jgi:hypothetical protein
LKPIFRLRIAKFCKKMKTFNNISQAKTYDGDKIPVSELIVFCFIS